MGRACRCQVEYLLDGGVAYGARRPAKAPFWTGIPLSISSSYVYIFGKSLFSRYLPGKGEAKDQE